MRNYKKAMVAIENQEFDFAILKLEQLGNYKNSRKLFEEVSKKGKC